MWNLHTSLETHGLAGTPGLLAVSGGADSVALLLALANLADVAVVHFNHQLRGAESNADEHFVQDLCAKRNVPCYTERLTIPSGNLENEARQLRYLRLSAIAMDLGKHWVATGHTADDQAETLFHRMFRGTGLAGLRGIAAKRPIVEGSPVWLIRPMLHLSRADVEAYLRLENQSYRVDSTNADPDYTRNAIRQNILPVLKQHVPELLTRLGDLARCCASEYELLETMVSQFLSVVELPKAGAMVVLKLQALEATAPALRAALFRRIWLRERWPTGDYTQRHWQQLAQLTPADYPGRVRLTRTPYVVRLECHS
jgi:tRNA(Ile)-lysidine synthase